MLSAIDAVLLETGAAALLFALVFVVGYRVHLLPALGVGRRSVISFSAGISTAYVFVHLLPELATVRRALTSASSIELRYEGAAIYFVAMIGFLTYYGLDHLRLHLLFRSAEAEGERTGAGEGEGGTGPQFYVHIGGFAAYVWLASYLLLHSLEESQVETALYAGALAVHFLTVEHSLHAEHGAAYRRIGRWVLAGMALAGWIAGVLFALPHVVIALLVAFISGAVVLNSANAELPSEKDGRFLPFVSGAVIFGLVLLPLG